jgi:hypothetical protein
MPGWPWCASSPTARGYRRRSPPRWPTPTAARRCTRPGRCSPIWRPQSPTAPTASTASANCAATVSTCSGRRRRPPRCGGWSINGSTPHTCPGSARPGASPERRRGRQGPPLLAGSGCTSTSTPRWSSIIPTTRNWRRRPGRKPTVTTRCWRFWTAPRSPGVKRWRGCCVPAVPVPTPPPTTSPSWNRRWRPCPRRGGPTRVVAMIRTHRRCWCAATPPGPPTISPRPAAPLGWVLVRLSRRLAGARRRRHPQPR